MHPWTRAAVLACAALAVVLPAGPARAAGSAAALSPSAARAGSLTWAVVPSPNRNGPASNLDDVSCAAASACTAVGASFPATGAKTLAEAWNGNAWAIVPSPDKATFSILDGVSCTSAAACTAVGESYSPTVEPKTLIESWNGTAWTLVPSPNPAPGRLGVNYLDGVSCTSASACMAVGSYNTKDSYPKTLTESWNGTTWTVVPSPNPAPGLHESDWLSGVSCPSAAACTAVGYYQGQRGPHKTVAESWNGTAWTIMPSPSVGSDALLSVSCTSPEACTAVGNAKTSGHPVQAFAETWNGTAWTIVPAPSPAGTTYSGLSGISCTSAAACAATGYYQTTSTSPARTLIESWSGSSWSIVPSPNAGGTTSSNSLGGVSCPSAATCTAVGNYSGGPGTGKTLIEVGTSATRAGSAH